MQGSLFAFEHHFTRLDLPGADVRYYRDTFNQDECRRFMHELVHQLDWKTEPIKIFGKEVDQPRLMAWVSEPGIHIRYSGISMPPQPWIPCLLEMKARCEAICGVSFNGVLLNYYRHGQDSMGWHSDDERELGPRNTIASISLGATRKFQLKPRHQTADVGTMSLNLESGSLLIMAGDTQKNYKHQVPKTSRPVGPRINLTFRLVREV